MAFKIHFILLRLGESLFNAAVACIKLESILLRAYILEGYKLFFNEDDKYFEFIKEYDLRRVNMAILQSHIIE